MYIQCEIQKENSFDITWVEEAKAEPGRKIRVKHLNSDEWLEGWSISKTYPTLKATEEQVKAFRDAYKHHRSRTDI